jgi:hypothetical protein
LEAITGISFTIPVNEVITASYRWQLKSVIQAERNGGNYSTADVSASAKG